MGVLGCGHTLVELGAGNGELALAVVQAHLGAVPLTIGVRTDGRGDGQVDGRGDGKLDGQLDGKLESVVGGVAPGSDVGSVCLVDAAKSPARNADAALRGLLAGNCYLMAT